MKFERQFQGSPARTEGRKCMVGMIVMKFYVSFQISTVLCYIEKSTIWEMKKDFY